MEGFGRYAAPIFMGASLLYALGQKHRREMKKERQEGAHNRCVDQEEGREGGGRGGRSVVRKGARHTGTGTWLACVADGGG